jgi:putative ABC transport system ATP-binding protein
VTHELNIARHTRRVVRLADGVIVDDRPVANPLRVDGRDKAAGQTAKGGA